MEAATSQLESRKPAVFVVDDDEPVRDSTCALLESHGMPVESYGSATDFLGAAALRHGDCLILDNHMPDMTGVELVEALRARAVRIPIIMFTGRADITMRQRAMQAGVLIVLDKPVNEELLIQAISIARLSVDDIH
jgi:two-component system, LuxR family, response regulator FixJ